MRYIYLILLISSFTWSQENYAKIKLGKDCYLELNKKKFNPSEHKLEFKNNILISIDSTPIFGTDGEIPISELSKAVLTIKDKTYNLQVDNMYNPWFADGVNIDFFELISGSENDHILKAMFSDGAGTYATEWLIEWNSCIRDIITKDEVMIQSYFEKQ